MYNKTKIAFKHNPAHFAKLDGSFLTKLAMEAITPNMIVPFVMVNSQSGVNLSHEGSSSPSQ